MAVDPTSPFLESIRFEGAAVKFCERFDNKSQTWNTQRHAHPYFELIFFVEGRARIDAGADSLDISLFDVLIYPPGLPHHEHPDPGARLEIICLWVDLGPCPAFDHAIKLKDARGTMRQLFELIYAEYTGNRPLAREVIARYLETLFLLIRQQLAEPPRESHSQVERCLSFIHEHYAGSFDIGALARTVHVSPSYLFRIFRNKMGVTPMHYRNLVRIEKAKLLLLDRGIAQEAIAERLGFEDVKYFARVFKNVTGSSPSGFRRGNAAA